VTQRSDSTRLLVLTDLDGTLLHPVTYSYHDALPALGELKRRGIPLILVSSKTRAEMETIRERLQNREPFIAENGGAVFVPEGYFRFPLDRAISRGLYQVLEFGTPYAEIRTALNDIARTVGYDLKGFGDLSVDEIATKTGLSYPEAVLAKQREYDEPFTILGTGDRSDQILQLIRKHAEQRGLRCVSGGQFHHLTGLHDKGKASHALIRWYRRQYEPDGGPVTIGLGDSDNDLPMLAEVDQPVLIQKTDGSYASCRSLTNLLRSPGVGPIGWNQAVLALCQRI
jgi:mannosyl-3-phosphoglycerate phosphatase